MSESENELYLDVLVGKRPDGRNIYVRDLSAMVDSARDAALERAEHVAGTFSDGTRRLEALRERIRALKSQPARQYLDAETVREVLRIGAERCTTTDGRVEFSLAARALGLDLDAALPKLPHQPSSKRHWLNDVQECSDRCPACAENTAHSLNPDGTEVQ